MQLAILWALAAGMALLGTTWGFRNRRAGYQRPQRRPLLEEGFRLLRRFEQPEPLPQSAPAPPPARETRVEQLVSLSLAVQSTSPVIEPVPETAEDTEAIHSPT